MNPTSSKILALAAIAGLAAVVLLVACRSESDQVTFKPQAMSFAGSEWSEPVNVGPPVNSAFADLGPALSRDQLSLYLVSTRPGGQGGADIWVSRRASLGSLWGDPVNLGPKVNGPGLEASPTVSLDGHLLFFSSDRSGGYGSNDIYVARRADPNDDLGWGPAVNLGPEVNTAAFEAGGFYLQSAEEGPANLYFARGPNTVALDIYVVAVTADGEAQGPAVPVAELNHPDPAITDAHPSLRVDGREVFFHSNRAGGAGGTDLWTSTRASIHDPWAPPVNLGAPLNTAGAETQPTLSFDGRTLVFAAIRPGGLGGNDLWMSTRTPSGR